MKIIDTRTKVTKCLKHNKEKKLYNILVILDDIADAPEIARHNQLLQSLYARARHTGIAVITASQKDSVSILHPVIRVNATQLFIFRLRNKKELDRIIEELGALGDPKVLLEITATAEDFNVLYVDLMNKNINDMFYQNFSAKIQIEDN